MCDRRRVALLAIALLAVSPLAARGKAGPMDLDEMYWAADLVVIGRTTQVTGDAGWSVATLEIERVIKGSPASRTVRYLASPTWTCDVSDAAPGERVLIFLGRVNLHDAEQHARTVERRIPPIGTKRDPVYWIVHSGRGQLPIERRAGKERIRIHPEVILPDAFLRLVHSPQRQPGDDAGWYGSGGSLTKIVRYLQHLSPTAPTPTPTVVKGPLLADQLQP
jgi:hypothetical protein